MGERLLAKGTWESNGDANIMRDRTAGCIRKAPKEMLVWNGEVQGKVEAKKTVNAKLVESKDGEEKLMIKERYKATKKQLGGEGGDKKMYKLDKARERTETWI
ncbi:hypothetical protein H5410_040842, partial [Solanum commersonii]